MARRKVRPGPLEDRSAAILRAIIEEYVATAQPVGSVALVEKYALSISPATVRNIMAELDRGRLTTWQGDYQGFLSHREAELAAEELRTAIRALDSLIGRVDVENLLDEIFASFCLGK